MWKLLIFLIFVNFHGSKSFLLGPYPTSCDDPSIVEDGVYNIYPNGVSQTQVYCEFSKGRWLRMMNNIDHSVDAFRKNLNEFKIGFGSPSANFWFGLENLRKMSAIGLLELRIEMNDGFYFMEYTLLSVGTESEIYPLNVVHNKQGNLYDSLTVFHNNQRFWDIGSTCGSRYSAGWWFNSNGLINDCYRVCLTCKSVSSYLPGQYYNNTNWIALSNSKILIRPKNRMYAKDCYEIYKAGRRTNGMYVIYLDDENQIPTKVYCEMGTGGWTRILSRDSTDYSFVRNFLEYKSGFGDAALNNSWFGLNNIHTITNKEMYQLRIELTNSAGSTFFIVYEMFFLSPESDGYRLYLGKKVFGSLEDALAVSNGQKFINIDFFDDLSDGMCTLMNKGGWWYNSAFYCYHACLTCVLTNPVWSSYNAILAGAQADLKFSKIKMMVRSISALKDDKESNAQN